MTSHPAPASTEAHDEAWDLLTGTLEESAAEALLEAIEDDADALATLLDAADELVHLHALDDAPLRTRLAGADADGLDVEDFLALDHDPDALLDAAIADGDHRQSSWGRFQRFLRRPTGRMAVGMMAAAAALFVLTRGPAPVPDHAGGWTNGASEVRATPGVAGRYVVGNEAALELVPLSATTGTASEVRVFVGRRGGPLTPANADVEHTDDQKVRVFIDITPELGIGTHRVVVLVGRELASADPETDTDDWARFETEMVVVEAL